MQYVIFDTEGELQLIVMTTGSRTPEQDSAIIRDVVHRHQTDGELDWSQVADELNENFHIMGFRKINIKAHKPYQNR